MYPNRLAGCKPCSNKAKPTTLKPIEPVSNNSCELRKITSISQVNGKVVVMYDDCSYTTADISVLSLESFRDFLESRLTGLEEKIKLLEAKEDKDTVYDDTVLKNTVNELKEEFSAFKEKFVVISDLGSEVFEVKQL